MPKFINQGALFSKSPCNLNKDINTHFALECAQFSVKFNSDKVTSFAPLFSLSLV